MLKVDNKKQKIRGISFASLVAILQGSEAIIFTFFAIGFSSAIMSTPGFAGATLALKELFAFLITSIIFGFKLIKALIKKWKTKQMFWFIMAGSLGTSLGNAFYILAVALAGAGYGVILTATYPIFSMLLIKIFLREKEPKFVWIGVFITSISGILLFLLPQLVNHSGFDSKKFIGMFLGLLSAVFWAIEGLFIKKGMDIDDKNTFSTSEVVYTRSISATLMTLLIIMPILMIFGPSYKFMGDILMDWRTIIIISAIVVNIIVLRYCHVAAIATIGPKLTAIIDTNNFIIPALFSLVLAYIPGQVGVQFLNSQIAWWAFLLLIPIGIGVSMVIYFHRERNIEVLDKFIE